MAIRLEIAGITPPSLNRIGSRGNWRAWDTQKKLWQQHIGMTMLMEVQPKRVLGLPAIMDATLWFPVRRNRDEGNFRSLLEKAAGDALVRGGWIPDDTPDCFRFGTLTFLKGQPCTVLVVREGWGGAWSDRQQAGKRLGGPTRGSHT